MTGPVPKPAAEVEITEGLVRSLLRAERPDLAAHRLVAVEEGWDNAVWRLGDDLSVRLPRRALSVSFLSSEQRWLPLVAQGLTLGVPTPVHLGQPTAGFPWPWSICRWVAGRTLLDEPLVDQVLAAAGLDEFLSQMHQPAPDDAPRNPFRGGPLSARDESIRGNAAIVAHLVDVDRLLEMWDDALAAPGFEDTPVWIHGDLHPRNVLAIDGTLSGVIDFGDMGAGDPAVDLASAWTLLDVDGAQHLRTIHGADDATWRRARGWAVNHGILCLANSADEPTIATIGRRTIARLLDDAG